LNPAEGNQKMEARNVKNRCLTPGGALQAQLAHQEKLPGLHRARLPRRPRRAHPSQEPTHRPLLRPLFQQTPGTRLQSWPASPRHAARRAGAPSGTAACHRAHPVRPSPRRAEERPRPATPVARPHPESLGRRPADLPLLPGNDEGCAEFDLGQFPMPKFHKNGPHPVRRSANFRKLVDQCTEFSAKCPGMIPILPFLPQNPLQPGPKGGMRTESLQKRFPSNQ
jgi:hypothetical protein